MSILNVIVPLLQKPVFKVQTLGGIFQTHINYTIEVQLSHSLKQFKRRTHSIYVVVYSSFLVLILYIDSVYLQEHCYLAKSDLFKNFEIFLCPRYGLFNFFKENSDNLVQNMLRMESNVLFF